MAHQTLWPPGCRDFGSIAAAQWKQEEQELASATAMDVYTIKIVTGNLRGAGTPSPAWVQLVGAEGVSDRFIVGEEDTFERGSTRTFSLQLPTGTLGQLRRVHIDKRAASLQLGDGWFLKQVEVEGPGGMSTVFPCNAWLGESDCGGFNGPFERNLLPAVQHEGGVLPNPQPVSVTASGLAIPHPEKVLKAKKKGHNTQGFGYGGEDAYFVGTGSKVFGMGVADGIYMWKEQGIDAGLMSRELMQECKKKIEEDSTDVFNVLGSAINRIHSLGLQGSSTVCILAVDLTTGQLHSANLGDSGFLVFGRVEGGAFELKFRTNQLEHTFGCPYQVGHQETANKVEDGDMASFGVVPGDIIVMGSDGLLDNVADLDMMNEVQRMQEQGLSSSAMVQSLTKMAFTASMDRSKVTPYSKGASEAFDMVYSGGKPDDITVMVALVK